MPAARWKHGRRRRNNFSAVIPGRPPAASEPGISQLYFARSSLDSGLVALRTTPRNDEPRNRLMTTTDDPLVSTEWLAAHLNDPKVKVLDATFKMPGVLPLPKDDYLKAHIPGAVFFDVDAVSDHSNPLPHMFPSAAQFGSDVGALGISNADTVVVYDSGGWVAGPRAWWMLLSFGHDKIRVLNGGLKKWRAEGRPVQSGEIKAKPASFKATFDPNRVRSMREMIDNV